MHRFRDLSIRHKLPLMLIGIVSVILLVAFAISVITDVADDREQMKDRYSALAKIKAANSGIALQLADLDSSAAEALLSELEVNPSIVYAGMYDVQGEEVAKHGSGTPGDTRIARSEESIARFTDDGFLDVVEPVLDGETIRGTIYLRVTTAQLDARVRREVGIVSGVFLAALVAAGVLSMFLQRLISIPIQALAEATRRVSSEHDYSVRVSKISEDELGILCDGFNAMLERIEQKELQLANSNTELESTVQEMASTVDQLQHRENQLEHANAELDKTIRGVHTAVEQMSSMSRELLATIAQQSAGARQQAAAVSQTVTTMEQVAVSSNEAAETAKNASETAQRMSEAGEAGRAAVEDCIVAMREVNEHVQVTAENTLSLAERAQAIGEIIETVKNIAGQINLLALNAAIEASRAGEYGRGFAVVASDVKQLAEQSQKATQQIRHILGEIREATNKTVLSTEQSNTAVKKTTDVVMQAGDTIDTLARALEESSRAASQIVTSARQQAEGVSEVAGAMTNIDQTTQQAIAAARQVELTAQNLSALSIQLSELIAGHDEEMLDERAFQPANPR